MLIILAILARLKKEDGEFEASLSYIASSRLMYKM